MEEFPRPWPPGNGKESFVRREGTQTVSYLLVFALRFTYHLLAKLIEFNVALKVASVWAGSLQVHISRFFWSFVNVLGT